MGVLRLPEDIWTEVSAHLQRRGEHFAFLHAGWTWSVGNPVLWATGVTLVPDNEVSVRKDGHEVSLRAVVNAVNVAVREGSALIEVHNHGGDNPRWSSTDRDGLSDVVPYMLSSLPGRPYCATVWAGNQVFGEWFSSNGRKGELQSVTVTGRKLQQVVSRDYDGLPEAAFARQEPWFTARGQRQLGRMRVAVVGNGGTGAPLVQSLAYMGVRDFLLVDQDSADQTSMNRLVTAGPSDLGVPKVELAARLIRSVAPNARVDIVADDLRTPTALEQLRGVDLIVGCLDNDGGRLVLNELSLAYRLPYVDLAAGIDVRSGQIVQAGGRVALVLPDGPCLGCMGEIDAEEAGYFLAAVEQREQARRLGYVQGMDEPAASVVSLCTAVASTAASEIAIWFSGVRPPNLFSELDLLGRGRGTAAQWLTPKAVRRDPQCIQCRSSGVGDGAGLERYAAHSSTGRAE